MKRTYKDMHPLSRVIQTERENRNRKNMSAPSSADREAYRQREDYQRRSGKKFNPDGFDDPVKGGWADKAGLTTSDLQERKVPTLLEHMKVVADKYNTELVDKNAFMVYTYDRLLAILANFRANPLKLRDECRTKRNTYKFGQDCNKIDKLIAIELLRYSADHGMKEAINHNPDYWINIPVFLEGTSYALFSMFDLKDQWQPPASELTGTPEIIKAYNPDGPTANWIVQKLDIFNEIFPGYGVSAIDLYMLAKLGWLLDPKVQNKVVSLIKKNDHEHFVQIVIQYVPTLRAIMLYNYNFKKPDRCDYMPLDMSLGRKAGKDQSPTHYTEGVYKFLMDHFNRSSVGKIMLPGLKFTADELIAWLSMLDVKKLERGTIAKMVNEATLESYQKERLAHILNLYFTFKPEDRAAEISRMEKELATHGVTLVYNRLMEKIMAAGHTEPMITHLIGQVRSMAGVRPSPNNPDTVTSRIHPHHPVFYRQKPNKPPQ